MQPTGQGQPTGQDVVVVSYFALRVALVLLVVLLFAGVVIQLLVTGTPGCFQTSLSAYYYTPVRSVFVVALGAVGVCLVLYRGATDLEDVFLNFSGFLAVVVAFVPTGYRPGACDTTDVPTLAEAGTASTNNVLALFVVGFLALVAGLVLSRSRRPTSTVARVAAVVTTLALVGAAIFFGLRRAAFQDYGHITSAVALFVGFIAVVVVNAVHAATRVYTAIYVVVAVAMPVGAVVAYHLGGFYRAFWVETVLITLFAVFWAVQTYELRDVGLRPAPAIPSRLGRFWTEGAAAPGDGAAAPGDGAAAPGDGATGAT